MSTTTSIVVIVILYLLIEAATHLPRLVALAIASVTGSVLARCKRRGDIALLNHPPTTDNDRWQRSTRSERRLLRRALQDTMRLTIHRSLFPDVCSL